MRRLAFLFMAALALGWAGCGGDLSSKIGGGDLSSKIGGGSTMAAPHARPRKTSPEEVARAVNLRATDFPYLRERGLQPSSAESRKSQAEFEMCVGGRHLKSNLASVNSPNFTGTLGGELLEFSSSAEVFASPADAARAAAMLHGHRVLACLSRLLRPALERDEAGSQLEVVSVKAARLRTPAPSIAGSFGYRIAATVAPTPESRQLTAYVAGQTPDGRPTITVYLDDLAFVSERIGVELTATGGPLPAPRALERNLLKLLRSRAEAEGERLPREARRLR
jgi:hypothetical protein